MSYKMKTKSGAAKRFQVKKSGKVKFGRAYARHSFMSKTGKVNRRLRGNGHLADMDAKKIRKELFPYG